MMIVRDTIRYPIAATLGALVVLMLIVFSPALIEFGARITDTITPVVTDWHIDSAIDDGNDLILTGSMIKRRSCRFVPPTIARDPAGLNHAVISSAQTAGVTWPSSPDPQKFGPWRIVGGAGKTLTFLNVYLCGDATSIATLGVFKGVQ